MMTRISFFALCLSGAMLISLLLCLMSGCKTRKVATDKTAVKTEERSQQSLAVHSEKQGSVQSQSSEQAERATGSKTLSSSKVDISADSVVTKTNPATGEKKTTAYGVNVNADINKVKEEMTKMLVNKQNSLQELKSEISDSTVNNAYEATSDSTSKHKEVDAKGSGRTWPWVAGMVFIVIGIVWVLVNRAKKAG